MTERLHFHFSLSCTGEGNSNPLQCSCLENPRDGGAWWAAIYGVAQSRTRLKRLNSSSKNSLAYWKERGCFVNACPCSILGRALERGASENTWSAAAAKSLQSCLTLCDPIDGSPPGSPVPGILQARTLEWVAIFFPNA